MAQDTERKDSTTHASKKVPLKVESSGVKGGVNRNAPMDDEAENRMKARKGALFLGVVVILYIAYLVISGQMIQFVEALANVDLGWVALAGVCFCGYFFFGVIAYAIAVYIDHDSPVGVRDLMSVEASGIFFGNLTPMMAGAVPSQIVRLTRTGLEVGEASATQFTRFIMFQFGVVLFAAIMLFAKLGFFFETYGDIVVLNLIVFGVHFLELTALFVICLCPNFVMKVGNALIAFLSDRGWLKNVDHWNDMVNVQVMEFSKAFMTAAQDLPSMGLTLIVTMAQLACFYMIPWFVLNAFGQKGDFLNCLAAGSMVQMVATAVPLPGGTGGTEGSFYMFYGTMFGTSINAGFLVWRIVTFFAPTILSVPLLGLRSRNRSMSIYERVQRIKRKLLGTDKTTKLTSGATFHPKKK
ncbi:MAG: lysylphosphatidylglycerol synthase transmembrane domain-containing protein [Coriobacteriales bacterium]|nr:lysylphosphatidylglycerol synthase transmembrane domain-containing protein [Coriobacteriales bacterium]